MGQADRQAASAGGGATGGQGRGGGEGLGSGSDVAGESDEEPGQGGGSGRDAGMRPYGQTEAPAIALAEPLLLWVWQIWLVAATAMGVLPPVLVPWPPGPGTSVQKCSKVFKSAPRTPCRVC